MPWFDLPAEKLREYRTSTEEPADLDGWWAARLDQARAAAKPTTLTPHEPEAYGPLPVLDVEFSGADGDPIRAWYLRPPGSGDTPLPTVVTFIGYGGGRGLPAEHALLPASGFAQFVMDTRGQGGKWSIGATGDPGAALAGPAFPGMMTRGIQSPETYYYTRLMVDAARAVEVAAELDGVDRDRIAVSGVSQGGGLSLAAAALSGDLVKVCHADVPFLCDFQRAVTLTGKAPYSEIADFLAQNIDLVDTALDTLRYVDGALLARRITAECLLSTGLMDDVCPPSTVYAAYNEIKAAKDIAVFPFTAHSVPRTHVERQLRHLRATLAT
ncbi:acetylxylan esterase [Umezawaea tangerina]|uniref:Cephalosporin-C deacetylase n=1 Tax=Umezawaea tangerina TaxID=84725 RepID=A0A2T0SZD8_9PSEU|nr:acetylxylan esterase [Umezawaea tangerina]PRY38764.1 cephalosporin-C deacetylase [Umezawaea tangerina]